MRKPCASRGMPARGWGRKIKEEDNEEALGLMWDAGFVSGTGHAVREALGLTWDAGFVSGTGHAVREALRLTGNAIEGLRAEE